MTEQTLGYEAEPQDVDTVVSAYLDGITDPLERYHRATSAQAHHLAVVAALADERARAAYTMWKSGLSYGKLAELGLGTRGRAQQLVERGQESVGDFTPVEAAWRAESLPEHVAYLVGLIPGEYDVDAIVAEVRDKYGLASRDSLAANRGFWDIVRKHKTA